ncbi:MAG: hypothetical protein BGO14_07050 [Chlamydiales bacterium 38-26]|nr:hypothetical protein [Chlamydiales bacterium]OJV10763.1 MAG: hypothetical protein BGO14_07050 [Chlamydiales bacterium 38-26]
MTAIPSVGVFLNQLHDRMDQTIEAAKNADLQWKMKAEQVKLTVENARIEYENSLNLTMDRIDQVARNALDQISILVSQVESSSHAQGIERKTRNYTSSTMHLASTRACGNVDFVDYFFKAYPTPGWHVVRGSSSPSVTHRGECKLPTFVSDDDDVVVYKGSTLHKAFGCSGIMDVTISFIEYQDVPVTDHQSQDIISNAIDGSAPQFVGNDLNSSDNIKVENQEGGFVIKATKPKDLEDI